MRELRYANSVVPSLFISLLTIELMKFYTVELIKAPRHKSLHTVRAIKNIAHLPLKTCLLLYNNIPVLIYTGNCRTTARKIAKSFREVGCTVKSSIL